MIDDEVKATAVPPFANSPISRNLSMPRISPYRLLSTLQPPFNDVFPGAGSQPLEVESATCETVEGRPIVAYLKDSTTGEILVRVPHPNKTKTDNIRETYKLKIYACVRAALCCVPNPMVASQRTNARTPLRPYVLLFPRLV